MSSNIGFYRENSKHSLMVNYLSESEKTSSHKNKGSNVINRSNLLCPSTFIRLYKSEKQDLVKEKKQQKYNSMNKQFKEDNSLTSDCLSEQDILFNQKQIKSYQDLDPFSQNLYLHIKNQINKISIDKQKRIFNTYVKNKTMIDSNNNMASFKLEIKRSMSSGFVLSNVQLSYIRDKKRKSVSNDFQKKYYINKKGNLRQFMRKKLELGYKIR